MDGLMERVNNTFQHLLRCFLQLRWIELEKPVASSGNCVQVVGIGTVRRPSMRTE
jgi:hypothetical protein